MQYVPQVIVTNKLKSYGNAKREILPRVEHRQSRYLNNWIEVSHQPTVSPAVSNKAMNEHLSIVTWWVRSGRRTTIFRKLSFRHRHTAPARSRTRFPALEER